MGLAFLNINPELSLLWGLCKDSLMSVPRGPWGQPVWQRLGRGLVSFYRLTTFDEGSRHRV